MMANNKKKILIVGKLPPPIGGVTIHVNRLIDSDVLKQFDVTLFDLGRLSLFKLPKYIIRSNLVHNHTSNPYFRLILALFCFFFRKRLITTFHGNLGRYGDIVNLLDKLTIKLSNVPVVLNDSSLKIAKANNKSSLLITSFIPPNLSGLDDLTLRFSDVERYKGNVFCTNASALNYDKFGNEIYSIFKLVELFRRLDDKFLIISDPSCQYYEYFLANSVVLPLNIKLVTGSHCFSSVINYSNVLIRATTTDGDSISIREALFLGKPVIASNVVTRPQGCYLYNTYEELYNILKSGIFIKDVEFYQESAACVLAKVYSEE